MKESVDSILVVDDEADCRGVLLELFRKTRAQVRQAADGRSALDLIDTQPPHLVLLDNRMPGMSGFDVLVQIRQRFTPLELPVIMLTSDGEPEDIVKAFDLGANDFIVKPANLTVALARVRTQLAARQTEMRFRAAAKELARSNRDLQQFAQVASHDLQEPLRKVAGALSLVLPRLPASLDRETVELIDLAVDGARRMQELIRSLLDYATLNRPKDSAELCDVGDCLKQALSDLAPAIREAGASVTYDGMPVVRGDARQMARVFLNLIGNAIKFQKGGTPVIHVGAIQRGGSWEFSVTDNGIGIPPERFGRLFRVFERLCTRAEFPGNGMGLAICRQIVEGHGGTIWVESAAGAGSSFRFTIPRAQDRPDEPWFDATASP